MGDRVVDLDKLLRISDLFLKKNERGELGDHVCAYRYHAQLCICVKTGVVHREIHNLFVVDKGCQVGSS